jgi:hypothetical protein
MSYWGNKGRVREIRVGRFEANMGGEAVSVKSPTVDSVESGLNKSISDMVSIVKKCGFLS